VNRRLAALVLSAAALTACGSGTVTPVPTATSAMSAPEAPRVQHDADRVAVLPPVVSGPAPAVAAVGDDARPRSVTRRSVSAPQTPTPVQVTRKPRPVRTPPTVAADVPALVTPVPVVTRSPRPLADPPVVDAPTGSSTAQSTPDVPTVVISAAPVVPRSDRPVADPPIVVGDTQPAADALATDDTP